MALTIDTQRIDDLIIHHQARVEQILRWRMQAVKNLNTQLPVLEDLLKGKLVDVTVGNIYSTHMGDEEYTKPTKMICWVKGTVLKKFNAAIMVENIKQQTGIGTHISKAQAHNVGEAINIQLWVDVWPQEPTQS